MIKGDYVWWDDTLKRWDVTFRALLEQGDPKVHAVIDLVVRSWFIPNEKEVTNESITDLRSSRKT